eukprot:13882-Heterococcus_DN1.PRE.3
MTQELVNLLLIGRAHSNVFDGQQTLGSAPSTAATTTTITAATAASSATTANCDGVVLRGITHRGPVGFLTLYEAYGHAAVGDRYKCPLHPVWVVCSESHYSVLFASQAQPAESQYTSIVQKAFTRTGYHKLTGYCCAVLISACVSMLTSQVPDEFDLYYYDPLGQQDSTIRLTVNTKPDALPPAVDDSAALTPPLDLVIRTKWCDASVDWNGTDPIL